MSGYWILRCIECNNTQTIHKKMWWIPPSRSCNRKSRRREHRLRAEFIGTWDDAPYGSLKEGQIIDRMDLPAEIPIALPHDYVCLPRSWAGGTARFHFNRPPTRLLGIPVAVPIQWKIVVFRTPEMAAANQVEVISEKCIDCDQNIMECSCYDED